MTGLLIALTARPKLVAALAGAAAIIAVLGTVYLTGRSDGADSARDQIRDEFDRSREAGQDVFTASEACIYAGREWDQSTGVCR